MQSVKPSWARSDFVVLPVEKDQSQPDINMWSHCAVCVIQPEVTAWSSCGWNFFKKKEKTAVETTARVQSQKEGQSS